MACGGGDSDTSEVESCSVDKLLFRQDFVSRFGSAVD